MYTLYLGKTIKNPFSQKTVLIGDTEYIINRMSATKALTLQPKVLKLVGRSLAELLASGSNQSDQIDAETLGRIMDILIEDMDKVDFGSLAKELTSSVFKGSSSIDFDNEFTGNLVSLYKLLFEVVKFNYLDVFTNLASKEQ